MKGSLISVLGCVVLLQCFAGTADAASNDVCRIFPTNTKIRDPESCKRYITCVNGIGTTTTCASSTPYYNKDTEKCVKTLTLDSNCEISCADAAGRFISDPKSCKGYYYCQSDATPLYGTCPDATHFNVTQQSCIFRDDSECSARDFEYCSIVKNGVNFNDESDCANYFVCTKGVLTKKSCSKEYYHAATGKCVQKSAVNCLTYPFPKDVCGTDAKPKRNTFISDGATCRGYFFCTAKDEGADKNPQWRQCPADTFFNEKTQSCVHPLDVKCSEDRCDGRSLTFVSSNTKGCRNYLRCKNGISDGPEMSCGNFFFDEATSTCVSSVLVYTSCKT